MSGKGILVGLVVLTAAGFGYYHYELQQAEQKLDDLVERLQPLGTLHYTNVGVGLGGSLYVDGLLFEPHNTAVGRMRAERVSLETGNLWRLARLRHTLDARRLPQEFGFSVQGLTLPAGLVTGNQGDPPALSLDTAGCGSYHAAPPDELMSALGYHDIPLDFAVRYDLADGNDRMTVHSTFGMGPLSAGSSTAHFSLEARSNRARDLAPALINAPLQSMTVVYEDRGYYPALMEFCAAEMDMTLEDYTEHHMGEWVEAWRPFGLQPGPTLVAAYEHFIQAPRDLSLRIGPIDNPMLLWANLDSAERMLGQIEHRLSVAGRHFGPVDLYPVAPEPARTTPQPQTNWPQMRPERDTQAEPSTTATIALTALEEHIGHTLRITLADGRARNAELLAIEGDRIRVRRRVGSGYMEAPIALSAIAEVRRLR
ncbi:hypothetical protein [Thioalkalivibrio sp. ALE28]|uniref:hypothetical protein n=1 Tax=Thioalkalivibrio sp. ALE28 TaxID=1158179 RepID=UPI000477188B|nr:hypothetical protein [Thioalkalivibrio sp. ALE28]